MNITRINKKFLFSRILLYNFILLIFLVITAIFIFKYKLDSQKEIILEEQKTKFTAIKSILNDFINNLKADTLILSRIPILHNYILNINSQKDKDHFFSAIKTVMDEKKYLDKVLLLDSAGNEISCIIQYKDTYSITKDKFDTFNEKQFFEKIINLRKSDVFISDFDYNVFNEKYENPMKPIVSLATPVYSGNERIGYIVISYLLSSLSGSFSNILKDSNFKFYLLNSKDKFLFFNSSDKLLDEVTSSPYKYMIFKRVLLDNDNFFSYDNAQYYKENININLGYNSSPVVLAIEYPQNFFSEIKKNIYNGLIEDIIFVFIFTALLLTTLIYLLSRSNQNKLQFKIFEDLVKQSNDSIIITDTEGNILFANDSFLNLFEITSKNVLYSNVRSFNSDFHDNDFYSYLWKKINTAGFWEGELISSSSNSKKIFSNLKVNSIDLKKTKQKLIIWTYKDLTEAKYDKIEILKKLLYDNCTGLPNKINIAKHLAKLIKDKTDFAILSINITNITDIIKNYGFDTEDIILVMLTEKLKKLFSYDTFIGRLDEKQIIIVQQSHDFNNLEKKFKKIMEITRYPFNLFSDNIYIKLSMNTVFYPEAGENTDDLLNSLKNYNYNFKEDIPRFLKYFSNKSDELDKKKKEIFTLIQTAISNNEFSLYYQPWVDIKTNKIIGAETLMRWTNKHLGLISPNVFIEIAEEFDYIDIITNWTLENLCLQIRKWKRENQYTVPVSINISSIEFCKKNFSDMFLNILSKYELGHTDIEIEITENVLTTEDDNIDFNINKLKEFGFKILIDDFGIGNSSLSYLKSLNIDTLKIDREFIRNYPEKDNGTLAKIITDTAIALKLNIVATGVETEEQVNFLRNIGCNVIQGYYYSKPVEASIFEKLLNSKIIKPDYKSR